MARCSDNRNEFQPAPSRGALVPLPDPGPARRENGCAAGAAHAGPCYSPFLAQLADQVSARPRGAEWRSRLDRAAHAYASAISKGRLTQRARSEMKV